MSEIEIPQLPDGDTWEVQKSDERGTVKVWWKRSTAHGSFVVASITTKHDDFEAFTKTYEAGLIRLKRDEKYDELTEKIDANLSVMQAAADLHNGDAT